MRQSREFWHRLCLRRISRSFTRSGWVRVALAAWLRSAFWRALCRPLRARWQRIDDRNLTFRQLMPTVFFGVVSLTLAFDLPVNR